MSDDLIQHQQNEALVRHQRFLLIFSPIVYFLWWLTVELILDEPFNPLGSRLAVCASFFVVLALSFKSKFIRKYIDYFYALCVFILTIHYYYLFSHNPSDVNWVVGSYITVVAAGMTMESSLAHAVYAVIVLVATWYVVSIDPTASVVIPGTVTILLLLQVVAFLRNKADQERQRRIIAEGERATIEAASRAKSLFLANMSHELRTPLVSIIGFSDIMNDDHGLSKQSKESLERVRVNSQDLMEKVTQILNLTESDFGLAPFRSESIHIRDLISYQVKDIEQNAKSKNILVSQDFEGTIVEDILGDSASINRVLHIILGNAIKFTAKGEIRIGIATHRLDTPDTIRLTIRVQDTGIGITASNLPKIFDPFWQADDGYTRPFGGVGLGLTVAKKLALAMGGDVVISESTPGVGTIVTVTFKVRTP